MCLYHYTSLENFFSIVQGRELWLTNIHFLNDYMENRLFLATAANLMRERAATANTEAIAEFYRRGANFLEEERFAYVYCCCFSRLKDDLGQWRAYADDGRGVAIGFDVDEIMRQNASRNTGIKRVAVEYDDNQHRSVAEAVIDRCFQKVIMIRNSESFASKLWPTQLRFHLAQECARIKAKEFASEQEERLVFDGIPADPIIDSDHYFTNADLTHSFRIRKNMIVPFVKMSAPRTSICRVVLGPCFGVGENEHSLRMFLKMEEREGPEIDVQRSRATYRTP